jgi:glycine cleavage system H protein
MIINRRKEITRHLHKMVGTLTADMLKIYKGVFFSNNHTWAHLDKSGTAEVGLDNFLLNLTGEAQINHQQKPGEYVRKGDLLTEIEQKGKVLRIYSPISGKILVANMQLNDSYEMLLDDPFVKGWIYKLEPSDWKAETGYLFLGEEATLWLKKELERFKDFIATSMGRSSPEASMVIFQEGGELRNHCLAELPDEIWQDFQKEFLDHNQN